MAINVECCQCVRAKGEAQERGGRATRALSHPAAAAASFVSQRPAELAILADYFF